MNRIKKQLFLLAALTITGLMTDCMRGSAAQIPEGMERGETAAEAPVTGHGEESARVVTPGTEITELEEGFSAVRYDGDYWFDEFLARGGAKSDSEVIDFLTPPLTCREKWRRTRRSGRGSFAYHTFPAFSVVFDKAGMYIYIFLSLTSFSFN